MNHKLQPTRWALALAAATAVQFTAHAAPDAAEQRASQLVSQMTLDEKIDLVFGHFGSEWQGKGPVEGVRPQSAGYAKGNKRLCLYELCVW